MQVQFQIPAWLSQYLGLVPEFSCSDLQQHHNKSEPSMKAFTPHNQKDISINACEILPCAFWKWKKPSPRTTVPSLFPRNVNSSLKLLNSKWLRCVITSLKYFLWLFKNLCFNLSHLFFFLLQFWVLYLTICETFLKGVKVTCHEFGMRTKLNVHTVTYLYK